MSNDANPYDHMICTKCRKILEFEEEPIEQLQIKIAANHGFHMLQQFSFLF